MELNDTICQAFHASKYNSERGRAILRNAVLDRFKARRTDIKRAFALNDDIKTGKRSTKPTPSGLRDALTTKTLALLVSKTISVDQVLNAVNWPEREAETDDDGNPLFGVPNIGGYHDRNREFVDGSVDDAFAALHHWWVDEGMPTGGLKIEDAIGLKTDEPATATETNPTMTAAKQDIDAGKLATINGVLSMAGLPPIEDWQKTLADAEAEIDTLKASLASKTAMPSTGAIAASNDIPEGTWSFKPAHEAIILDDLYATKALKLAGDLPVFTWEHDHPMVPEVDPHYNFRSDVLISLLFALQQNKRVWLYGHSGTGKTSALEQLCARIKMPLITVSLDSDVSRMDLMGRDTLVADGSGASKSVFVDGVLPKWLDQPCFMLFDECDYGRPDVMYVLQRALEHKALVVEEDGNRVVHPHPLNRIAATGNTKGGGDETGLYPGARVQSAAFLNRFTNWVEVEYMDANDEIELLKKRVPGMPNDICTRIGSYIDEHRRAFTNAEIMHPISPRTITALGEAFMFCKKFAFDDNHALNHAFKWTLAGGASAQDGSVMDGIANRTLRT